MRFLPLALVIALVSLSPSTVHAHLGLSDFDYSEDTVRGKEPINLDRVFERWYPSFESRSGWKMDGAYQPMSDDIRATLARFYAPFNQMLFELAGEKFDWQ